MLLILVGTIFDLQIGLLSINENVWFSPLFYSVAHIFVFLNLHQHKMYEVLHKMLSICMGVF